MSTAETSATEKVSLIRLLWAGPLAVVAAVLANAIVGALALRLLGISPRFLPLAGAQFIFLTVVGTGAGVIVFAVVSRLSKRPIRLFRLIAIIALLLSFAPDLALLAGGGGGGAGPRAMPMEGVNLISVGTLMFMHIVAAVVSVGLMTTLAREP
jgi:hypothetical protein